MPARCDRKMLHSVTRRGGGIPAQGKHTRVPRAFVQPWVPSCRGPTAELWASFYAVVCRGRNDPRPIAASTVRRVHADVVPRPLLPPSDNPGRRKCSLHSHSLALGWNMATPAGNAVKDFPPSFNGKPKATAFRYKRSRLRLAVKRPRFPVFDVYENPSRRCRSGLPPDEQGDLGQEGRGSQPDRST